MESNFPIDLLRALNTNLNLDSLLCSDERCKLNLIKAISLSPELNLKDFAVEYLLIDRNSFDDLKAEYSTDGKISPKGKNDLASDILYRPNQLDKLYCVCLLNDRSEV